ncbi:MAG: 1,4-dihydroxy-2-naphthoate polyprenyltransferase [Corynebacterium sp.]|nr:1,4-dihydroxy-2-naphthoate polyprenyltransferase [Corynebacterium sp.]
MPLSPSSTPATARDWWEGARPHTWANAFAPVIAGSGAAAAIGSFSLLRACLAMLIAWALIVAVNFANDYSDGIRGTDDDRQGPQRLTGGGLAKPIHVKLAAFLFFGVAALAGIILLALSGAWWMLIIGAACIAAAWFYTGGTNPYGYRGLGEVAIFVFFGLVAVLGTQYTQAGTTTWTGLALAMGIGGMSSAVNLANNIRDIPSDTATGKITLAVRLGDRKARALFTYLLTLPTVLTLFIAVGSASAAMSAGEATHSGRWAAIVGLLYIPFAVKAVRTVNSGARGLDLVPVLGLTGRAMLIWSILTAFSLAAF